MTVAGSDDVDGDGRGEGKRRGKGGEVEEKGRRVGGGETVGLPPGGGQAGAEHGRAELGAGGGELCEGLDGGPPHGVGRLLLHLRERARGREPVSLHEVSQAALQGRLLRGGQNGGGLREGGRAKEMRWERRVGAGGEGRMKTLRRVGSVLPSVGVVP